MRHPRQEPDPEEEEEEEETDEEEEPLPLPPRRSGPGKRAPPRAWSPREEPEDEEEDSGVASLDQLETLEEKEDAEHVAQERRESLFHRPKRPVFFRARDSLWFEPLVAAAILVLIIVSLWAFTQNWPPMYVVESESMQHGSDDHLGLINTGDLVLAQKVNPSSIIPYVAGTVSGYSTYGEYGDVILYYPNGDTGLAPVIHRAMVFIEFNSDGTATIPDISGLPCGSAPNAVYTLSSTSSGCGWSHITGTLTLLHVGWRSVNVTIALGSLGTAAGFITLGDNNLAGSPPTQGITDQLAGKSALVRPTWIIGVARGMIPWFGALKLLTEGQASEVPSQSWALMGITIIAVILGAMGIHYAFRAEGIEDERRLEEEEEEHEAGPRRRSFLRPLREWMAGGEDEEPEEDEEEPEPVPRRLRHRPGREGTGGRGHADRGRPRPKVRRGESHRPRHARDTEDEL